jgi:NAD(P)-dependent dehydrogenase (short-subunit alcohol dehydrogenase family)
MPGELDQRHVVITGGAGALGSAVVDAFIAAGAVCHLPVHGAAPPELETMPGVRVVSHVDLSDDGRVETFFATLPPLSASIHLAGGFAAKPIAATSRADLERQLTINLVTAFLCCREAVRNMRRHGGGRIVNVAARAAEQGGAGMTAYAAAKAAVAALTRALADEVRMERIQVNAVAPSVIDTPANRTAMPDARTDRWPKPAEIARTILWLASPENALISGALIPVYGRS